VLNILGTRKQTFVMQMFDTFIHILLLNHFLNQLIQPVGNNYMCVQLLKMY